MAAEPFESTLEAYPVRLLNFEGPLDLLLHLIRQHQVNVYDIPIATITQQYLEYLEVMQELNLDIAGDFLVMAATLIHIKSRTLLPRPCRSSSARLNITSRATISACRWTIRRRPTWPVSTCASCWTLPTARARRAGTPAISLRRSSAAPGRIARGPGSGQRGRQR